jgi:uncharacterized protein (DUF2267 family)
MTMTGLPVFDETVHLTNTWLHELTSRMGWDDRQKGYRLLRVSLHALRDRLPVTAAAQLSAQLPMLLRGVYFEGWQPARVPVKLRDEAAFLRSVRDAFSDDPGFDAAAAFREVIAVMRLHVSPGEIEDLRRAMPEGLKPLWETDYG